MVKKISTWCLCLFLMGLSFPCMAEGIVKYEYTHNGYQATMLEKHWNSFNHAHSGYETPEAFLQYAAEAMERIVQWGGGTKKLNGYREAGSDIVLSVQFITTNGMSRVVSSNYGKEKQMAVVALKDGYLAYHLAPVIHEITHVIYQPAYSRTLREGLASYVQDELGEFGVVHNYGLNPHEICQNVIIPIESNQNLFGVIGSMDFGKTTAMEQRSAFYVASYSFMAYLIESYGIDTSLKIYSSMDEEVYAEQTGKTLAEIRKDWLRYLQQYESDFSVETIRAHTYDLALRHGIPKGEAESFSEAACRMYGN